VSLLIADNGKGASEAVAFCVPSASLLLFY